MLSSPRKPVSTMQIFSSAENCRRVARRIPFTTCSAGSFTGPDFFSICAPFMATVGQKTSLPQLTRSVSVVLMPDRLGSLLLGYYTPEGRLIYAGRARTGMDHREL